MSPIPCFRGETSFPELKNITEKYGLEKPFRIRNRRPGGTPANEKIRTLLANEKKIERGLRSKCGLDAIFEMSQMAPWRETSALETGPPDGRAILMLDFKNFYPAILCAHKFPHPAKLRLVENPTSEDLQRPGLARCRLHLRAGSNASPIRRHHPFQIQNGQRGLPFRIDSRPIDTLLHTAELPVWGQWFDVETLEAILSEIAVKHPLAHRTLLALKTLEEIRRGGQENQEAVEANKLIINLSSTTPRLGAPTHHPCPHGVPCLPSQIAGIGRAMLCHTAHLAMASAADNELLMTNTDGFLLRTKFPEETLQALKDHGILGDSPGQLREKGRGDEAVILGPNLWWLLENGRVSASCGIGKSPETVPLFHRYSAGNRTEKIATIHLADFRHRLDHESLKREKMAAPNEPSEAGSLAVLEKKRSFQRTLKSLRDLRKRLADK